MFSDLYLETKWYFSKDHRDDLAHLGKIPLEISEVKKFSSLAEPILDRLKIFIQLLVLTLQYWIK